MTRANVLVGALAAVCVGTLLWCAWLILAADLTLGTSVAAWGLWLLVAAAATTLVAYVRELGRHRHAVTTGGSWKPLPSLVLVWIGGLTAVAVFAFMLPSGAAQNAAEDKPSAEASPAMGATTPVPSATSPATPRVSSTTASRSKPRTTPTTSPTAATRTTPAGGSLTPTSPASRSTTTKHSTTTTSTTTSPTSTKTHGRPSVTITLP